MGRRLKGGRQALANAAQAATLPKKVRPLDEILTDAELVLHDVHLRLVTLITVDNEIRRCAGNRPVEHRSDITWQLLNDSWARCLLTLSSWAKGATARGGLVDELRDYRTAFVRTAPSTRSPGSATLERRKRWAVAFGWVFPRAHGEFPHVADFAFLRERIDARLHLVRRERNNLAHMYDRRDSTGASLDLPLLRHRVLFLKRLLKALRLVGLNAQLQLAGAEDGINVVHDIVDRLLLGPFFDVARRCRDWQTRREEIYAIMRAADPDSRRPTFNGDLWSDLAEWTHATLEP